MSVSLQFHPIDSLMGLSENTAAQTLNSIIYIIQWQQSWGYIPFSDTVAMEILLVLYRSMSDSSADFLWDWVMIIIQRITSIGLINPDLSSFSMVSSPSRDPDLRFIHWSHPSDLKKSCHFEGWEHISKKSKIVFHEFVEVELDSHSPCFFPHLFHHFLHEWLMGSSKIIQVTWSISTMGTAPCCITNWWTLSLVSGLPRPGDFISFHLILNGKIRFWYGLCSMFFFKTNHIVKH